MKRLVILGGGTAGTMAANKLRAALPRHELQITVVDRDDNHHYQPGYLFMPFGTYTTSDVVRSRHRFIDDGVELVLAEIDRVDPDARAVHLADGRVLPWDYLVVATGTAPRPDAIEGMAGPEYGASIHQFYDLEGAQRLTEAIRRFRGGRMVVHMTDMPIKCPVAPLEFTFLAHAWLTEHGIRDRTELTYVTPLDGAFTKPVASRELATALTDRDIQLETDFMVESVDNEAHELVSYDGRRIGFDLLVTVPLNMGADWVARSGMGDDLNYVPCDQHTMQSLQWPDVFVLGDAGTLNTSKAGSVAHFAVEVFVENFRRHLRGEPMTHGFDGHANCFIESGGGKGMLLDFNYDTQPFTGTFPLPVVGPMSLLKETRLNHWAKLAFRWVYWNMLLPGRPLPFTNRMSLLGKRVEADVVTSASGPGVSAGQETSKPTRHVTTRKPSRSAGPTDPARPLVKRPTPKPAPVAAPAPTAAPARTQSAPTAIAATPDWDESTGELHAQELGIDLTPRHWEVLNWLRADFPARGETATLRRTATVGGFAIPELFQLFPGKPAKTMSYIAGLPKPKGCV